MTTEQFDLRLKTIAEQYEARREAAEAYRDQELARLFHDCGWTQEKIAEHLNKQGKHISRVWVCYRLCFGAFLDFVTTVTKVAFDLKTLTERRFRGLWAQTDQTAKEARRPQPICDKKGSVFCAESSAQPKQTRGISLVFEVSSNTLASVRKLPAASVRPRNSQGFCTVRETAPVWLLTARF